MFNYFADNNPEELKVNANNSSTNIFFAQKYITKTLLAALWLPIEKSDSWNSYKGSIDICSEDMILTRKVEKYLLTKDRIQKNEIDGYDITFFGIHQLSHSKFCTRSRRKWNYWRILNPSALYCQNSLRILETGAHCSYLAIYISQKIRLCVVDF